MLRLTLIVGVVLLVCEPVSNLFRDSSRLSAQPASVPARGEPVESMGLPKKWQPYGGLMLDWERRGDDELGGQLLGGLYRDLMNPNYGLLGLASEAYVRTAKEFDGGVRLLGAVRFFGLQAGADYSFRRNDVDFVLSLTWALRRSGLVGRGSYFRADWYPGRNHSFSFGLQLPLFQPHAGKTRPQEDSFKISKGPQRKLPVYTPGHELQEALASLDHAAEWQRWWWELLSINRLRRARRTRDAIDLLGACWKT